MTQDEKITALLLEAEPLRLLPEDDQAKSRLSAIVDEINVLRAVEAGDGYRRSIEEPQRDPMAPLPSELPVLLPSRRPGRPRNPVEGADA